jgi:hypothetical protein
MRAATGLVIWIFWALASFAQQPDERVTVLYCYGGNGCQAYLTPFSPEEMDKLLNKMGTLAGEGRGKPVVFLTNNAGEEVDYVDQQRSLEEINVLFGGAGEPPMITTYPDLGDIQPLDGTWTIAMDAATTENCLPGVENAMAGFKLAESGAVTFSRPFMPEQALPSQSVKWLKLAPNRYRAVLPGSDAMFATYDLVVEGTDRLAGTLVAVTLTPGQNPCTITLPISYEHNDA